MRDDVVCASPTAIIKPATRGRSGRWVRRAIFEAGLRGWVPGCHQRHGPLSCYRATLERSAAPSSCCQPRQQHGHCFSLLQDRNESGFLQLLSSVEERKVSLGAILSIERQNTQGGSV